MKTKEPSDREMKKHKLDESGPSNNINQWSILPIHTLSVLANGKIDERLLILFIFIVVSLLSWQLL